jgi:hypothetical protein
VINRIATIAVGLLLASAAGAGAQGSSVGFPPTRSPYIDLEHAQEITFIAGQYHAHRDPANAGPQSGLLLGAHYEWRPSGPIHLIAELARISSNRQLINPAKAGAARDLGIASRPLYAADAGLGLSLTGGKSWHHLVPEVAGGVGFISDLRSKPDSGGFKFGTRFALNWGGGLRYVPGGKWQIRGDVKNRMYSLGYPQAFYITPTGGNAVVPSTQPKSFWTNNPTFTLGLSYLF